MEKKITYLEVGKKYRVSGFKDICFYNNAIYTIEQLTDTLVRFTGYRYMHKKGNLTFKAV